MGDLSVLAAAEERPTDDCLVTAEGVLSFSDVGSRVQTVVASLRASGVTSGDRVAIIPRVDVDSIVRLFALFELGCPAVLLHPRLQRPEIDRIVEQTAPKLLLDTASFDARRGGVFDLEPVPDDRTLAVVYTSGSSAVARGALLKRSAFIASCAAHTDHLGWVPHDRWLLSMPPAHVGGLSILTRSLIARRAVVLAPGPFDAPSAIGAMTRYEVTLLSVVPTMLARLLDAVEPRWGPTPWLRAVLVGGAPLSRKHREEVLRRKLPVLATYGCTEACSQVTTQRVHQVGTPGSGTVLPPVEVRIQHGEIQLRGPTMMHGYVDGSPAPWTEDGWLATRDAGAWLEDGQLDVLGRLDDMILSGGENVSPREVEAVLESLGGVHACSVFGVPHAAWGQEVVAAIATGGADVDRNELRTALRDRLASFKRPKRIAVVESLPLNRSGKVDRQRVREAVKERLEPL